MNEPKLPGVTLRHRDSKRYQIGEKQKAEVVLEAEIEDETIWEQVEHMLLAPAGYRIYTQEDFKGELLNVFQEELRQVECDAAVLRYEKARLELENGELERQLAHYKGLFDGFNKQFGG